MVTNLKIMEKAIANNKTDEAIDMINKLSDDEIINENKINWNALHYAAHYDNNVIMTVFLLLVATPILQR